MKKLILYVCFVAILPVSSAIGQSNISMGVSAGGNLASISNIEENDWLPSFNAGLFLIWAPGEHVGIGGEVRYSQEGTKFTSGTSGSDFYSKSTVYLNYIRIPLRITYFFGEYTASVRPKIFFGPTVGILTGARDKSSTTIAGITTDADVDFKDDVNGFDMGVHAGAGVNCKITDSGIWLNVDAVYTQGLMDVSDNMDGKNLNQNISLNIGLTFPFGYKK